jgi:hypothetical protein
MSFSVRKPPASQSIAQTATDNNLALALDQGPSPKERLDRQRTLAEIAADVRLSTGADGAAIALEDGGAVVCRARAGDCAPVVGAFLKQESGLSGLCLRSGRLVRCDDADSDERVDASVAHVLQIRSVLAVPVRSRGRVIGLVEVLSRTPNAFGSKEEETLLAATAEVLRVSEEDGEESGVAVEEAVEIAPGHAAHDSSSSRDGTADRLRALFSVNAKVAEPAAVPPVAEESSAAEPESAAGFIGETETFETETDEIETVEHTVETLTIAAEGPAPEPAPLLAGFDAAQAEPAAPSNLRAVVAGVVGLALLAGIGLTAWRFTRHKAPNITPTVQAGVPGPEIQKLRTTAEADDAAAQYNLAMRYLKGDGVAQSDADATAWLLKSAHLGNSSAQLQLGVAYELGRGVPQDFVRAYACYVVAGANGNAGSEAAQKALTPKLTMRQIAEGRTLLGEMYQGGVGTPVDNVQAYMWFGLAEAAGSKDARREKALLTSKLTAEQIDTASRNVAERLNRNTRGQR